MEFSDFELVKRIKEHNRGKDVLELYDRYKPMISKYFKRLCNSLRNPLRDLRQDYFQDAYISLLECVRGVKFSRIRDPQSWKFVFQFKFSLLNQNTVYFAEKAKEYRRHDIEDYEHLVNHKVDDVFVSKEVHCDLVKVLNLKQRIILDELVKRTKVSQIATHINEPISRINWEISFMEVALRKNGYQDCKLKQHRLWDNVEESPRFKEYFKYEN